MGVGGIGVGPVRAGISACLAALGKRMAFAARHFSGQAAWPVSRPAEDYSGRLARARILV
ncbi:hypothetical protein AMP9_1139 [plant metagenome]|uniref:Uncharacterized protein n=1 Tax=plant metagenome TaxID=1297885 RepID=A0A484NRX6_9ZZZZ